MKIIIISGPSGSGKTSLAKLLKNKLNNSYIISTDDFYKTGIVSNIFSKIVKSYFDKRISNNGGLLKKTIRKILKNKKIDYFYKYDFKNKTKKIIYHNTISIENLIIEGIFSLELLDFVSDLDYLLIKLKINKNLCMKRSFYRDQIERGKEKENSIRDFKNGWEIYKQKEKSYKTLERKRELIYKKDEDLEIILKQLIN